MANKLAIIGKKQSKLLAPYNNLDWDIWGCNVHNDFDRIPRFTLWFDIHQNPAKYNFSDDLLITRNKYPLQEILDMLHSNIHNSLLNNSMCYMLAYAYYLNQYTEICFYGCTLNSTDEIRAHQKEALRQLRMFGIAKNINVYSVEPTLFTGYSLYK